MSDDISIDISEALKLLQLKLENSQNFKKLLTPFKDLAPAEVQKNFDKEQDAKGNPWKKTLSPKTLQKDGDLLKDMQNKDNYLIDGNTFGIFTTVLTKPTKKGDVYFYGWLHDKGKGFTKREFSGISKPGFTKILTKIQEEI